MHKLLSLGETLESTPDIFTVKCGRLEAQHLSLTPVVLVLSTAVENLTCRMLNKAGALLQRLS